MKSAARYWSRMASTFSARIRLIRLSCALLEKCQGKTKHSNDQNEPIPVTELEKTSGNSRRKELKSLVVSAVHTGS